MAKKAKQGYSPASDFSGNYGDSAPVSDGKKVGSGDEMRNKSWSNIGGEDTFPSLKNPYIPKASDTYTMKGEKGVDKDDDGIVHSAGSDTWPNLQNPYVPKGETAQSYKMNNGKDTDLVVDK